MSRKRDYGICSHARAHDAVDGCRHGADDRIADIRAPQFVDEVEQEEPTRRLAALSSAWPGRRSARLAAGMEEVEHQPAVNHVGLQSLRGRETLVCGEKRTFRLRCELRLHGLRL